MDASSLMNSLLHISAMLSRQTDQILQERLGIGVSQFRILALLEPGQGVRQRVIADQLGQTEASISRQIKLLATKSLVEVAKSAESRRDRNVLLTIKGVKLTEAAKDVLEACHSPLVQLLTDRQRKHVSAALDALHAEICSSSQFACDQGQTRKSQ